jgi:hypothetical protein
MTARIDNARAKLDALIDFHLHHNLPTTGKIPVKLTPTELGKMLGQLPRSGERTFEYRGFTIVATVSDPVAERFRGGS